MMRKVRILLFAIVINMNFVSLQAQELSIYSSENFDNPEYLLDNNTSTITCRDYEANPCGGASICVETLGTNFIKSVTIDIQDVIYSDFWITISNSPEEYFSSDISFDLSDSYGEVTFEVNAYARYINFAEINCGYVYIKELYVDADYRELTYTYDDSGNRIARNMIISALKSAQELEDLDPQQFGLDKDSHILLYPNPTSGVMNFEVINPEMQDNPKIEVKLFSVNGSLLLEEEYNSSYFTIDISDQQNGTYLLDMVVNGKKQHFTIVKQ